MQEKQDLVMALSKEKHSLTKELQSKIREVKKEKKKIRKQMAVQQELFGEDIIAKCVSFYLRERNLSESESNASEGIGTKLNPAEFIKATDKTSRNDRVQGFVSEEKKSEKAVGKSNRGVMRSPSVANAGTEKVERKIPRSPLVISKVFSQHEKRLMLLQRDRDIYDAQNKKMMRQIMSLTTQLEDAKVEAKKCNLPAHGRQETAQRNQQRHILNSGGESDNGANKGERKEADAGQFTGIVVVLDVIV